MSSTVLPRRSTGTHCDDVAITSKPLGPSRRSCTWTVSAYRSLATLTPTVSVRPTWDHFGTTIVDTRTSCGAGAVGEERRAGATLEAQHEGVRGIRRRRGRGGHRSRCRDHHRCHDSSHVRTSSRGPTAAPRVERPVEPPRSGRDLVAVACATNARPSARRWVRAATALRNAPTRPSEIQVRRPRHGSTSIRPPGATPWISLRTGRS